MAEEKKGDGVNREGLHYRAGWVEALLAFAQRVQVEGLRATKREVPGLEKAVRIGKEMHDAMIETMRNAGKE